MHRLAAVLLVTASFVSWPARTALAGGDVIWVFQGIENINAMVEVPDQTGDGVAEIAVETYDAGASGDNLYLLSGGSIGSPTVLWSVRPPGGPSNSGGYGDKCLALGADMSSDGVPDLLLGTAWGSRTAHGIDTDSGATLWSFDTYSGSPPLPPRSGWVYSITPVGDLNANKIDDAVFACGSDNDGGYAVDGGDGQVIYRLAAADALVSTANLGDVNGDGLDDAAFGGGDNEHRVFCISGASSATALQLWSRDVGDGTQHIAAFSDVTGDGIRELLVGTWAGRVWCLSGTDGAVVWTHDLGTTVVMRVAELDDVDLGGSPDVAVASWDDAARVVRGEDGALIWRTAVGGDVWAIDRAADVDGDGLSEVIAGSFDTQAYLMSGVDGDILWNVATGNRVMSARGVSDLSQNGVPDVVVGTQYLSGAGGRVYALEGNQTTGVWQLPPTADATVLGIQLGWEAQDPSLRYHVYRRLGDPEALAVERRAARGLILAARLSGREALDLAREAADQSGDFERLTGDGLRGGAGALDYLDRDVVAGRTYTYRIGYTGGGSPVERFLPEVTARSLGVSRDLAWIRPVGAPTRPSAFRVELPRAARNDVLVEIFGVDGRLRRTLVAAGGATEVAFDGRDQAGALLEAAVYVVRATAGAGRARAKMVWLP